MPVTTGSPLTQRLLFALNFFRHPVMLGSIWPSSRYLVDEILRPIDWERAQVIVEYGPGVGTVTAEILRRMRPDAHLIAMETNAAFVKFLKASFQDPRLHVANESATDVGSILQRLQLPPAQYVVSGIPLGSMPEALRAHIVAVTRAALAPGGQFLVYQFTSRALPVLQRTFRDVSRSRTKRNIPPAHLFVCATESG
jgi:phospholipid N-methyltransferase